MSKVLRIMKRYFTRRLSGEIPDRIKQLNKSLNTIDKMQVSIQESNYWQSWFIDSQRAYLHFLKKARCLPERFIKDNVYEKTFAKIKNNDRLELKGIFLPIPLDKVAAAEFFNMLPDCLLPYLLGNIDEKLFYALMDMTLEGPYEYKSVQLEKGDIVIDAGANIGMFSALAHAKGCKSYAFEPIKGVIDKYLSRTAEYNPNITVCEYALSNKRDELFFDVKGLTDSAFVSNQNKTDLIKVRAIDLDTFANENKLPRIDFIKADIEGAERFMLMGATRVIKEFAPKISICSYHIPDDPQVLKKLILDANPNYVIEEKWKKMYAYVPGR